jgi:arylsulfatase A-like enzyme
VTDARYVAAQYDAEIAYNSAHLGAFFDELRKRGLYDESLIVAFSDHGEVLTDHEGYFDHHGLYDDNLHVPLIMKLPDREHAGRRVDTMVQMTDLPVTLLRAAGLAVPPAMEGADLLQLPAGTDRAPHENLYLGEGTWQVKRGVRTRDWKFIRAASDSYEHNWHASPVRELYNVATDPREQVNLANVEPEVAAELERRLDDWLARMKDRCGWEDPLLEDGPTLLPEIGKREVTPALEIT